MENEEPKVKMHERLVDRLVRILTKLNNAEILEVDVLAEEFKTSKRTILRDIERFRSAGVFLEKKSTNQYYLDDKELGKLSVNDIKNFAQISGVKDLYPSFDKYFLKELLSNKTQTIYEAKGYFVEDGSKFKDLFKLISDSIQKCQQIAFNYNNEARVVQPYKIIHHHGSWYLAAVRKEQLRTYRLSRMSLSYEHHDLAVFKRDPDIEAQLENEDSIWFGQDKSEVVLSVHAEVAMHFKQRLLFPEQQIVKELDDGSLLVSSRISHPNQLIPLVRFWIPHVKVVNPERMQVDIEDGLRAYLGVLNEK